MTRHPLRLALLATVLLPAGCSTPPAERPVPWQRTSADPVTETPSFTATWETVARSVEGRAIEQTRVGQGPRRVLWIGGIHGNEREGSFSTEILPETFAATADLARRATLTVVRDLNPDGSASRRRGNARGVDLNRNFPAANFRAGRNRGFRPLDQPETRFLFELIDRERPDLVLVCHSDSRRNAFINYDGPAREYAERFSRLSGYPVVESDELHSTPGSLGSWLGRDAKIPILTIEYERGADPIAAWDTTRDAILAVIGGV